MLMSLTLNDRYCIEICKAKCCYTKAGLRCQNLANDFKCQIHNIWRDNWCNYQTDEIKTAPIMKIIAAGKLSAEKIKQCCYANPKLLEVFNENQSANH